MTILRDTIIDQFIKKIKDLKVLDRDSKVIEGIKNLPAQDIADIIEELKDKQKVKLFMALSDSTASEVLNSLEVNHRFSLLKLIPKEKALSILKLFSAHDLAEIGSYLENDERKEFLTLIPKKQKKAVRDLLGYKKNSAGSIMSTDFIRVFANDKVSDVLDRVRKTPMPTGGLHYFYAVDEKNRFAGAASLRKLVVSDKKAKIADVINRKLIYAHPETDQEDVIRTMRKYNYLSLPVVNKKMELLGIILYDDVFSVMEEEFSEDITRLAGLTGETHGDEELEMSISDSIKRRLPWLTILLFLYILTANVISRFSATIESMVFLAAFMPLIAAMAGNSATQSLALVVRGLALREYSNSEVFRIIKKDAAVGVFLGVFNGIIIAIIASIWQQNIYVGFIVGVSLWVALSISTITGAIIPILFNSAKIDPAVASGPFVTTINDIISLSIYFAIATLLISYVL